MHGALRFKYFNIFGDKRGFILLPEELSCSIKKCDTFVTYA